MRDWLRTRSNDIEAILTDVPDTIELSEFSNLLSSVNGSSLDKDGWLEHCTIVLESTGETFNGTRMYFQSTGGTLRDNTGKAVGRGIKVTRPCINQMLGHGLNPENIAWRDHLLHCYDKAREVALEKSRRAPEDNEEDMLQCIMRSQAKMLSHSTGISITEASNIIADKFDANPCFKNTK
jgi:hypothetical protein